MSSRFFLALALIPAALCAADQAPVRAQPMGEVQNGVYHHNRTGIEFAVPADWAIVTHEHSSNGAQMLLLRDTVTNVIGSAWMKARIIDPSHIEAMLDRRLDAKAAQRNNFEGYRYRAESIQKTTIGGKQALSAVADYTRAGEQMVEYLTWVDGEKSRVLFSARMRASEFPAFQARFDAIIQSAMVP